MDIGASDGRDLEVDRVHEVLHDRVVRRVQVVSCRVPALSSALVRLVPEGEKNERKRHG